MADPPFTLSGELQAGTYVCLRTGSPFGLLIRMFLRAPVDHTIVVTAPGECVQATLKGVKRTPLSAFKGTVAVANTGEAMTPEQRAAVVATVEARVGDEYAIRLIPLLALRRLGFKWAWLLKICDDKDAVFCSELAAMAGHAAGLDWLSGESGPEYVTPPELATRKGCVPVVIS